MPNQPYLDPKVREAINAAMENNWQEALQLNQELLTKYPEDIDTLNRLARSLSETGKLIEAKKLYRKVLELDQYNQIAIKNLNRISSIRKSDLREGSLLPTIKGDLFLEESGKTRTIRLEDTAMPSVLVRLRTGDRVELSPHKNSVTVLSVSGERVGKLESEVAERLGQDIRLGSRFEAIVKSVSLSKDQGKATKPSVEIFIREKLRSAKVSTAPFPNQSSGFTPYVREEAMNLLSSQAPVPTEADDAIEEIEISELQPVESGDDSLEHLAEKENDEDDFDEG